jgi:hypothetical protein
MGFAESERLSEDFVTSLQVEKTFPLLTSQGLKA